MNGSGKSIGRLPFAPTFTSTGPVELPFDAGGRHALATTATAAAASARRALRRRRNWGIRTPYLRRRRRFPEAIEPGLGGTVAHRTAQFGAASRGVPDDDTAAAPTRPVAVGLVA